MMILKYRPLVTFCGVNHSLQKYLEPIQLHPQPSPTIPTLKLKSEQYLMQNWWSETPFQLNDKMMVPVFNFHTNQYLQQAIQLPTEIFNHPLRRDLIHRLVDYRHNLNKFTTKVTRNRAMTAGSGNKMRPQKKTGKARMGDKRAPHLKKGGKAHGAKARVFSYPLNAKIKLKALYALLTAKLAEGKIRIIDNEAIEEHKTKVLRKVLQNHTTDERAIFCFLISKQGSTNFTLAQKNIPQVICHDSYNLDIKSLLIADKIVFTVKGLQELIENLRKTHYIIYRQPHMPKIGETKPQKEEEEEQWDPEKPYEFKFKILAEYLDLYEKVKEEHPQLLAKELQKIRKIV